MCTNSEIFTNIVLGPLSVAFNIFESRMN